MPSGHKKREDMIFKKIITIIFQMSGQAISNKVHGVESLCIGEQQR